MARPSLNFSDEKIKSLQAELEICTLVSLAKREGVTASALKKYIDPQGKIAAKKDQDFEDQVLALLNKKLTIADTAKQLSVSTYRVSGVKERYIKKGGDTSQFDPGNKFYENLTAKQKAEIKKDLETNTIRAVAKKWGVSRNAIHNNFDPDRKLSEKKKSMGLFKLPKKELDYLFKEFPLVKQVFDLSKDGNDNEGIAKLCGLTKASVADFKGKWRTRGVPFNSDSGNWSKNRKVDKDFIKRYREQKEAREAKDTALAKLYMSDMHTEDIAKELGINQKSIGQMAKDLKKKGYIPQDFKRTRVRKG